MSETKIRETIPFTFEDTQYVVYILTNGQVFVSSAYTRGAIKDCHLSKQFQTAVAAVIDANKTIYDTVEFDYNGVKFLTFIDPISRELMLCEIDVGLRHARPVGNCSIKFASAAFNAYINAKLNNV